MATLGPTVTLGTVGPSAIPSVAYSTGFFAVQTPWGQDGVPTLCTSFTDYVRKFGGLHKLVTLAADGSADTWGTETTSIAQQAFYGVWCFFQERQNNPNAVAYVVRVADSTSGPTAAVRTFNDGGANNTTVTSKWKGAPGGATTVTIDTPSPDKGTGYTRIIVEHTQAAIKETYHIANAVDAARASRDSELVTITLPGGGQLPATTTAKKLGNGTPGTAETWGATGSDMIGTVDSNNNKTGLKAFEEFRLGTGMVCIPGFEATGGNGIASGLKSHCDTYYRLGIIGAAEGKTKANVRANIGTTASSNLAAFWPRIKVQDQYSDTGGTILVDPCGAVAGLYARMDGKYGAPHKPGAGIDHALVSAVGVERTSNGLELCDDATSNTLADTTSDSGPINTIREKRGVVVWGVRTLASDLRYREAQVGRVVGLAVLTCYLIGEPKTFEPIDPDGKLFAQLRGECYAFLYELRRLGALYGDFPGSEPKPTDAFAVVCDKGNNPDVKVGAGTLTVDIAIAPSHVAEQVQFNLNVGQPGFIVARSVAGA